MLHHARPSARTSYTTSLEAARALLELAMPIAVQSQPSGLVFGNLVLTDNGAGDTTISWAGIATSFPPANRPPRADIVGDGSFLVPTCDTTTANTVRVRTRDNTNTLVDVDFVVEIF